MRNFLVLFFGLMTLASCQSPVSSSPTVDNVQVVVPPAPNSYNGFISESTLAFPLVYSAGAPLITSLDVGPASGEWLAMNGGGLGVVDINRVGVDFGVLSAHISTAISGDTYLAPLATDLSAFVGSKIMSLAIGCTAVTGVYRQTQLLADTSNRNEQAMFAWFPADVLLRKVVQTTMTNNVALTLTFDVEAHAGWNFLIFTFPAAVNGKALGSIVTGDARSYTFLVE